MRVCTIEIKTDIEPLTLESNQIKTCHWFCCCFYDGMPTGSCHCVSDIIYLAFLYTCIKSVNTEHWLWCTMYSDDIQVGCEKCCHFKEELSNSNAGSTSCASQWNNVAVAVLKKLLQLTAHGAGGSQKGLILECPPPPHNDWPSWLYLVCLYPSLTWQQPDGYL